MVAQGKLPVGSGGVIDFQGSDLKIRWHMILGAKPNSKKAGFQAEVGAAGFNPKKAGAAEKPPKRI